MWGTRPLHRGGKVRGHLRGGMRGAEGLRRKLKGKKKKKKSSHVESSHALLLEDGEDGGEHPTVEEEEEEEEKEEMEKESQKVCTRLPVTRANHCGETHLYLTSRPTNWAIQRTDITDTG